MSSVVVKLGSSIVADDRGEVPPEVLPRIRAQLAELHRTGRQPVVVTSGAIARGMGVMELPLRPRAMDELQAASAVGQGKIYQVYDELLRVRGLQASQLLLTFFDVSGETDCIIGFHWVRRLL